MRLFFALLLLCVSARADDGFKWAIDAPCFSWAITEREGGDTDQVQDVPKAGSGVVPETTAPESVSKPSSGSGATGPLSNQVAPESSNRILVVIGCTTPACREFERKLAEERKTFASMGWRVGESASDMVQILDIRNRAHADLVDVYLGDDETRPLPIVVKLEGGKVVREIRHGCGTPFTTWNAYWLYTGKRYANDPGTRERVTVPTSGGYPVRGGWWSHSDGNLRRHLAQAPQHAGKFDQRWINSLSGAELESLHSDDHEGRVKWQYVRRTAEVSAPRAEAPVRMTWRYSQPRAYYCPNCPNQN